MAEKDTDNYLKVMEECIYTNPLPLLQIQNPKVIRYINNYIPYSIGMEFECWKATNYNINSFLNIPDILDVNTDICEQRYRIPSGIKGMVCLWNICIQLKLNSKLDLGSSNHYHFDFTDVNRDEIETDENNEFILNELETWGTALDLSKRSDWTRFFNSLGTLEIRIGEPSFDYHIIIKRLIQGSEISKKLKNQLTPEINIKNINKELALLKQHIADGKEEEVRNKEIIKSRIIKI